MDLSAFGVAARRLLISTFISILVTFAIPIALHNVDVANAQTKTCGTPGGPLCPKSLPQPEPWAYGLLGYGGVGPFSSMEFPRFC